MRVRISRRFSDPVLCGGGSWKWTCRPTPFQEKRHMPGNQSTMASYHCRVSGRRGHRSQFTEESAHSCPSSSGLRAMSHTAKGAHQALSTTSPDSKSRKCGMAIPRVPSTLESPCILLYRVCIFFSRLTLSQIVVEIL